MYLVYGDDCRYYLQAKFSILSALRFHWHQTPEANILVLTERPESFAGYPVTVETLTRETLMKWAGPRQYLHRAKNRAMAQIMGKYRAKTVLVDTDTYFTRSPSRLFDRIAAGCALLHKKEGPIARCSRELRESLARVAIPMPDGSLYTPGANAPMWNSGVVGLDPADRRLLDQALFLVDGLYARTGIANMEQLGLGEVLGQTTRLRQAEDIVTHYWGRALPFFDAKLTYFFARYGGETLDELVRRSSDCTASIPRDRLLGSAFAKLICRSKKYDGPLRYACKAVRYGTAAKRNEFEQAAQSVWRNRARKILARRLRERAAAGCKPEELETWLHCRELAPVREPSLLEILPIRERRAWREFWDEVTATLALIAPDGRVGNRVADAKV